MCTNPKSNDEPREHQYNALVNVRNTELSAYWTRYNIQSVLNWGLVVAYLSVKSDSIISRQLGRYLFLASPCGILLASIWLFFIIKSKQLLTDRWERHIQKYEAEFLPKKHRLFTNVCTEEEQKTYLKKNWDNLNFLARSIPVLLIFIWGSIGIIEYYHPSSIQKESDVLELKSKMAELSSENNKIKSEIVQLKSQLINLNNCKQTSSSSQKKVTSPYIKNTSEH